MPGFRPRITPRRRKGDGREGNGSPLEALLAKADAISEQILDMLALRARRKYREEPVLKALTSREASRLIALGYVKLADPPPAHVVQAVLQGGGGGVECYSTTPAGMTAVGVDISVPICYEKRRLEYFVVEPVYLVEEINVRRFRRLLAEIIVDIIFGASGNITTTGLIDEIDRRVARVSPGLARLYRYYLLRELVGYGVLDPILADREHIEDIVVPKPGIRVKVAARVGGRVYYMQTNIVFSEEELDRYIEMVVHRAGQAVTLFSPLVSTVLPGYGHRLTVSYSKQVNIDGSVMVIRMFPEPWNLFRIFVRNTVAPEFTTYLSQLITRKKSLLVVGVMGSGKTSLLNSLAAFIPKDKTIITIEDTPEIRLPHRYWIRHVTREAISVEGRGRIGMFELMKHALRESADYMIIGEVRGEEGRVWAQAIATGHGGLTTFHAENPLAAISRLTEPPINVDVGLLFSLYSFVMVRRDEYGHRYAYTIADMNLGLGGDVRGDECVSLRGGWRVCFTYVMDAGLGLHRIAFSKKGVVWEDFVLAPRVREMAGWNEDLTVTVYARRENDEIRLYELNRAAKTFWVEPVTASDLYTKALKTGAALARKLTDPYNVRIRAIQDIGREEGGFDNYHETFTRMYRLNTGLYIFARIAEAMEKEGFESYFRQLWREADHSTIASLIWWAEESDEPIRMLWQLLEDSCGYGGDLCKPDKVLTNLVQVFSTARSHMREWMGG